MGSPFWRTALITGASRGIGLALAKELAAAGTRVHLVAREEVALAQARAELDGVAQAHRCDVGDAAAIAALVRRLDEESGGLDLLIANAGVGAALGRRAFEWETFRDALHVNLCGAAATLTAALPAMVRRGRGHLVAISSLASLGALPEAEAYCVPKAGLNMLMDCLALDLAGTGVHATTVLLGFVRTRMLTGDTHALPQLLEPEEVARTLVKRLQRAPRTITLPRGLALAARVGAVLPGGLKRRLTRG